jgi:hypothetical protein
MVPGPVRIEMPDGGVVESDRVVLVATRVVTPRMPSVNLRLTRKGFATDGCQHLTAVVRG